MKSANVLSICGVAMCVTLSANANAGWQRLGPTSTAYAAAYVGGYVYVVSRDANGADYWIKRLDGGGNLSYDAGYPSGTSITASTKGELWVVRSDGVWHRIAENNWSHLTTTICNGGGTLSPEQRLGGHAIAVGQSPEYPGNDIAWVITTNGRAYSYTVGRPGDCWVPEQVLPAGAVPYDISIDVTLPSQPYYFLPLVSMTNLSMYKLVGGRYGMNWVQVGGATRSVASWGNTQYHLGTDANLYLWSAPISNWAQDSGYAAGTANISQLGTVDRSLSPWAIGVLVDTVGQVWINRPPVIIN